MGPRRCRRGRLGTARRHQGRSLQWGHADVGVEDVATRADDERDALQWGHADVGVEDIAAEDVAVESSLQWGHADVGVEDDRQLA